MGSKERRVAAILGLVAVCQGCGSGAEQSPRGEPGPVRIAGPVEPSGEGAPGPEIAGMPEPTGNPPVETPAIAEPANPRALELPIDERFLGLGIPPADPSRYRKWRQLGRIRVGQTHLSHAALTGSGGRILLAMSTAEATVRVYDRESRRLLANHQIPGYARFDRGDIAGWPHDNGDPMFLFGKADGLWLFHCGSGDALAKLDEIPAWQLRWSPDGQILVAGVSDIGTQTSTLKFFRATAPAGLTGLGSIDFDERVDAWSLSRDNRYLAVIFYPSDTVELIDLRTGESLFRVPAPEFAGDVALSPDGRLVAVGGQDLRLIDAGDPSRRAIHAEFGNNIGRVRFSPSGDAVITSSYDGRVRVFGIGQRGPRLSLLKTLKHAGSSNVYELLFVDGGVGLISTSGDKTIRFWGR
jgi:WD40 repeat protein